MKKTSIIVLALAATLSGTACAQAAQSVGSTVAVNPDAKGTPPGGAPRTLVLGTGLAFNERIDTSNEGLVQVLLLDGTSMIIGANSSIVINKFVYDPNKRDGSLAVTLGEGTMRFIGGALSKKKGAQVTTPVGTLAIRGGIADLSDRKYSLVFGKELVFIGKNGTTWRVAQGYTLDINSDGTASAPRKSTPNDVLMKELQSKRGQNGGSASGSGAINKQATGFADINSNQSVPVGGTETETTATSGDGTSQDTKELAQDVAGDATSDQIRDDVAAITCPPSCMSLSFRILTAPVPTFNVSFGPVISNPGSQGLIGGTDDFNADTVAQAVQIDSDTIRVTRDAVTIDVPFSTEEGAHGVPPFFDFNGNSQQGSLFVGADAQFFFYALFENNEIDAPTYAFGGTPTPEAALTGGDNLLSYDVFADPRQGILMPFTLANLVPNAGDATVSPFYVMTPENARLGIEVDGDTPGRVLFGSLLISGQGPNQNSAASMLVGNFLDDDGVPDYGSGSRGSLRASAEQGALVNGGGISLIKGQPDRNVFFGPDADNAVLSTQMSQNQAIGYSNYRDDYDFETELLFSTMHVLDRVDTQAQAGLTRPSNSYQGYAAGMLESGRLYIDNGITSVPYRSTSSDLNLDFFAERDTMGASLTVEDVQDADPLLAAYHLSFGFELGFGGSGRGTYVDEDRYGASSGANPDPSANFVVTDTLDQITIENDSPDDNFGYFFGSELAPQTAFFAEGHQPCVCKFLEWGYWGGRRDWFDPDANENRFEFVHLGTWVAGNITNEADLPTEDATATYFGHAVGSVTRNIEGTDYQYLAGGGFGMSWNFASRNGTATISDFDGIDASAPISDTSLPNALNSFAGGLSGTDSLTDNVNTSVSGGLNGSFVSGPGGSAQGVIGSFDLVGATVSATGIVAGELQP